VDSLAAFLFDTKGTKRKAIKREMPFGVFRPLRRATGVSPPAHEKLLKKFYQNFHNVENLCFVDYLQNFS